MFHRILKWAAKVAGSLIIAMNALVMILIHAQLVDKDSITIYTRLVLIRLLIVIKLQVMGVLDVELDIKGQRIN